MVISARGNGVKNRLGTIEIMSASANRDLEPTIRPCLKSLNRQIVIGRTVKEAYMIGYDWMRRLVDFFYTIHPAFKYQPEGNE